MAWWTLMVRTSVWHVKSYLYTVSYVHLSVFTIETTQEVKRHYPSSQIARFVGPTWGKPGADRTQVGPMLAPWTLLSGLVSTSFVRNIQASTTYMQILKRDIYLCALDKMILTKTVLTTIRHMWCIRGIELHLYLMNVEQKSGENQLIICCFPLHMQPHCKNRIQYWLGITTWGPFY